MSNPFCPFCLYFNPESERKPEILRCSPNPSGFVPDCLDFEKKIVPKKRARQIKYFYSDHIAIAHGRDITDEKAEIRYLCEMAKQARPIEKHEQSGGHMVGLYLYLEDLEPFEALSFINRLKALKKKKITKLYLNLRGA